MKNMIVLFYKISFGSPIWRSSAIIEGCLNNLGGLQEFMIREYTSGCCVSMCPIFPPRTCQQLSPYGHLATVDARTMPREAGVRPWWYSLT